MPSWSADGGPNAFTGDGGPQAWTADGSIALPPIPPPGIPAVASQVQSSIQHTTFLLEWGSEDLCLDASGNIAVASAPYSIAQDVATQMQTFLGEVWYDTTAGVPYWQQILGKSPPLSLIVDALQTQALLVPDTATATATLGGPDAIKRGVIGQMLVTDTEGTTFVIPIQ